MNSPVSCLRDPIQNMVKKNKNKKKSKAAQQQMVVRRKQTPYVSQISAPVAYGATQGSKRMYPVGQIDSSRCIVKNFELATAFGTSNGAFKVDGLFVNPGIAANFPWLYTIARNYQKFRFHALRYFYSSSVSTATPGKAFINMSYDANDVAPATLAEAMASKSSCTGPAWFGGAITEGKAFDPHINGDANIYVDVDPSRFSQEWYYVRNTVTGGVQPSTGGALTGTPTGGIGTLAFTQGSYNDESSIPLRVYYGTNGVTNGTVAGELYMAYIIEFSDPVAPADTA
jgi:hypothetical protein